MPRLLPLIVLMPILAHAHSPLQRVDDLDLERYMGTWYEIARLPNRFQDQCAGEVTATYRLKDNGRVEVTNRCRLEDGTMDEAVGEARRPDPDVPAALEVRFAPRWLSFLPFVWGEYNVIALDEEYRTALVGTGDRKYLWLLARASRISEDQFRKYIDAARAQGFDTDRLIRTPQPAEQ